MNRFRIGQGERIRSARPAPESEKRKQSVQTKIVWVGKSPRVLTVRLADIECFFLRRLRALALPALRTYKCEVCGVRRTENENPIDESISSLKSNLYLVEPASSLLH